eukprot:6352156-Ditylum_brightwellii.AAC.1
MTSFEELSMKQTLHQQQDDLLNIKSFHSEDLEGAEMLLCCSSSKSIERGNTDEVLLHNKLCKMTEYSIDNK